MMILDYPKSSLNNIKSRPIIYTDDRYSHKQQHKVLIKIFIEQTISHISKNCIKSKNL